jgi:hypothetical protein
MNKIYLFSMILIASLAQFNCEAADSQDANTTRPKLPFINDLVAKSRSPSGKGLMLPKLGNYCATVEEVKKSCVFNAKWKNVATRHQNYMIGLITFPYLSVGLHEVHIWHYDSRYDIWVNIGTCELHDILGGEIDFDSKNNMVKIIATGVVHKGETVFCTKLQE